MDEKDKKEYELAVLVKTEEDLAAVVALIREHNGELSSEPHAKKLALAYEIKKNKEAVFAYCNFTAAPSDAKELERAMNTKAEIIRYLVIASPKVDEPSDRDRMPAGIAAGAPPRRTRTMRSPSATTPEAKPSSQPLSNEALEKKIEEILQ